jgi:hypothetical protein
VAAFRNKSGKWRFGAVDRTLQAKAPVPQAAFRCDRVDHRTGRR